MTLGDHRLCHFDKHDFGEAGFSSLRSIFKTRLNVLSFEDVLTELVLKGPESRSGFVRNMVVK